MIDLNAAGAGLGGYELLAAQLEALLSGEPVSYTHLRAHET